MPEITKYNETRRDADQTERDADGPIVAGEFRVYTKDGHPDRCEFICPCGCSRRCVLFTRGPNRQPLGDRKYWNYSPGPTLDPSVWWDSGCKAHFTLTDGKVIFV